jgi:integrase
MGWRPTVPTWIGSWKGGRIAESRGRVTFVIERSLGSGPTRRRITKNLGHVTEAQAEAELALFNRDPLGYLTPEEKAAVEATEKAEQSRAKEEESVVLDADLIGECVKALRDGYGTNKPCSKHHLYVTHAYLSRWAVSPTLHGRDLREITITELRRELSSGQSVKHRIVALKSLTAWLRWRGDLKMHEDPTLALNVPQAKRLGPAEKAAKVYDIALLEKTYRALPNQAVRDVFRVRMATGLHASEIARIARGEAMIRRLGKGPIAATVDVRHKSGHDHRQSIDAATLAALDRLRVKNGLPTEKTFARSLDKAAEVTGSPVLIGNLRHTFSTLATTCGRAVHPQETTGVPLEMVAQIVGHQSSATTKAFYLGTDIPPMITLPLQLEHPNDPPLPRTKTLGKTPKRRRGSGTHP